MIQILTIFLERYRVSLVESGSSSGDFDVSFTYANNFWFECLWNSYQWTKKDKPNQTVDFEKQKWQKLKHQMEVRCNCHWVFSENVFWDLRRRLQKQWLTYSVPAQTGISVLFLEFWLIGGVQEPAYVRNSLDVGRRLREIQHAAFKALHYARHLMWPK